MHGSWIFFENFLLKQNFFFGGGGGVVAVGNVVFHT